MGSTFDLTYYSMREQARQGERGASATGVDDEVVQRQQIDPTRSPSSS